MSTYYQYTKHPITKRWERACWMDDHYGRHHYGVRFEDGLTVDPWAQPLVREINEEEARILNEAQK